MKAGTASSQLSRFEAGFPRFLAIARLRIFDSAARAYLGLDLALKEALNR